MLYLALLFLPLFGHVLADDAHGDYKFNYAYWGYDDDDYSEYYYNDNNGLVDVNFSITGGHANATSVWDEHWLPSNAFKDPYDGWYTAWHSRKRLPQSLWFAFLEPVTVVKVSFQSRRDASSLAVRDGPKKYKFWGSNGTTYDNHNTMIRTTFDDNNTWTILHEDLSGDAFTEENTAKTFEVKNPQKFLAYGFEIIETNGKWAAMSNVHFFTLSEVSPFTGTTVAPTVTAPVTAAAVATTAANTDNYYSSKNLQEVNFHTMGGTARATSSWSAPHAAHRGFSQPGYTWFSAETSTLPQSIWYEFPKALRVMKYSFQSRTDNKADYVLFTDHINSGSSRYEFWGSSGNNCSNKETRVTLVEDKSGTPFDLANKPKVEYVDNPSSYRCYGFTIKATPGQKWASMSNIRLFYTEGEVSPFTGTTVAPTVTAPITAAAVTTTAANTDNDICSKNLKEVSFRTVGGMAKATSEWNDDKSMALRGFAQPGYKWHSGRDSTLPQSIWYEFPQALRVVKYSFQSRTDGQPQWLINNGPTRYEFWGSNGINCSNKESRVKLVEDTSGTPFTLQNIPKVEHVNNSHSYRCYGFTINGSGNNRYAAMSNIRLFYSEGEVSPFTGTTVAPTVTAPITATAVTTTAANTDNYFCSKNLREVSFRTIGGTARATSIWSENSNALRGFSQPGKLWHSARDTSLPQSIWYEFPQALRVMKYSFQSRTDNKPHWIIPLGASRYVFWGSNDSNCSNKETRVTLVEDTSGTPFTLENIPKVECVDSPHSYRCYGFTINDSPGKCCAGMSNIRFFYAKDITGNQAEYSSSNSTSITVLSVLLVLVSLALILLSVYTNRLHNLLRITGTSVSPVSYQFLTKDGTTMSHNAEQGSQQNLCDVYAPLH